jgi:hypothetical protein
MDRIDLRGGHMDRIDIIDLSMWSPRRLGHMFLTIPFNMFYYITLKYGNFLFETLDTFPLLKDAYTQSRKLYENRISSWYGESIKTC